MNDNISSAWTFSTKYVFPAIWIMVCGQLVVSLFLNHGKLVFDGVKGAIPASVEYMFLVMFLIGAATIFWISMPLKRVRLADGTLLVSNYIEEWRIPVTLIERVSQNRWVKSRPITIRFRADLGCGTSVKFMPRHRWRVRFWREDPEVNELRRLAGLHPPD